MPTVPVTARYALESINGNADATSEWYNCQVHKVIEFAIDWAAVAATNGTFFLEGTNDPAKSAQSITRFANAGLSWFLNGVLAAPVIPVTAGAALLVIENPMLFHRLSYVWVAGGAALMFNLRVLQRGV